MAICRECGADEPSENTFCTNCGTRLSANPVVDGLAATSPAHDPSSLDQSLMRDWLKLAGIVAVVLCIVGVFAFIVIHARSTGHAAASERTIGDTSATSLTSSATSVTRKAHKPRSDDETQSNLVQALGAETKLSAKNVPFTDNIKTLRATDPSLPWNDIKVAVRDVQHKGDRGLVCMSEHAPSGKIFVIAYVVFGPDAGEYEGDGKGCPTPLTATSVALIEPQPTAPPIDAPPIPPVGLSNGDSNTQISLSAALQVEAANYGSPALDGVAGLTERFGDAVQPGDNGVICVSMRSSTGTTFESIEIRTGSHKGTYTGTGACPEQPTVADAIALGHHW
jgi:hypothetical protein